MFFLTAEALVPGDEDESVDLFERSGGLTTQISTGQIGGLGADDVSFGGASADGTRVFFSTTEQLVGGDTDSSPDVYEWSAGSTTLVIGRRENGNGAFGSFFDGVSDDGTRALFETAELLTNGDTDSQPDVYERAGGVTMLVSAGQINGNGAFSASFDSFCPCPRTHASADGSRVFFYTSEQLCE